MRFAWITQSARAVAFCALSLGASQSFAESLTDAMISAFQTSNILDQQRALLRAADEDVVRAAATLQPVVNFVTSASFTSPRPFAQDSWQANATLTASLTLYDNGQTQFAVDAAKESVLALRAALLDVEQQVLLSAVQAYLEVIQATQFVSLSENNVRLITQELRAVRDRFQVGEVTRTDVAIAESRLAASRGNLAAARGDLEIAKESYKAVVGKYPKRLTWPKNPPIPVKNEAEAKALSVRNHPSIEEAQRNINATEATVRRAEAAFGPTVSTGAQFQLTDDFDSTFRGTLDVNVPIYSGGTLRSAVRQSVANRDAARSGLLQTVIETKRDVGIAWANFQVAGARVDASGREVRAAQIAFEGIREEARFGSRTTLDVLEAEQDLLDARTNLISAEVQQYVSLYALLAEIGLLTTEHLGLGIPTYDPVDYYNYANRSSGAIRAISPQGRALDRVLNVLKR